MLRQFVLAVTNGLNAVNTTESLVLSVRNFWPFTDPEFYVLLTCVPVYSFSNEAN